MQGGCICVYASMHIQGKGKEGKGERERGRERERDAQNCKENICEYCICKYSRWNEQR